MQSCCHLCHTLSTPKSNCQHHHRSISYSHLFSARMDFTCWAREVNSFYEWLVPKDFRGYCVERLKYRCVCVCAFDVCHAIIWMMMSYLDERCSSRWKRTSNKKETKSFTLGASISWSFVLNSFVFSFRVITQLKRLSWQMIASSSRWWSYHLDDERWWAI